jgi:thiol-disulfide isomerase/thioredoxin
MRPPVGLTLLLCALALAISGCRKLDLFHRAESPRALSADPRVGLPAPEIDGETFDGTRMKLSDYRGKVVVLVFWFSRCGPCKAMIPHERHLVERHRGKPFALLAVNNDENTDDARELIVSKKMIWPVWKTTGYFDPINKAWGVSSWPAVFVIDAKGVIRHALVRGPELDAAVDALLAETTKDASAKRR